MENKNLYKWIVGVLIILLILSGIYWYMNKEPQDSAPPQPQPQPQPQQGQTKTPPAGQKNEPKNGPKNEPTKLSVNANWRALLNALPSGFSDEGLITQMILRYKGFKGKNGSNLVLDGKVGQNTKFALNAFWKAEKVDFDDQDVSDLLNAAKVDFQTVANGLKSVVEADTKGKYTV